MTSAIDEQRVKEHLLELPVVKEDKVSNYRQTIIRAESHPSMFVGSTDETAQFVAQMAAETERFIRSSQGIARVEKRFLMNNYRVGDRILEIQYQQFWSNGTSSIYSEHVMRIGEDQFEVFGSTSSAARMKGFRPSAKMKAPRATLSEQAPKISISEIAPQATLSEVAPQGSSTIKAPRATSGKSTASLKSFTDKLTNKKALGFILLVAGILLSGVSSLLSLIITIGAVYILVAEFKPGVRTEIKILIAVAAGFVIPFLALIVTTLILALVSG